MENWISCEDDRFPTFEDGDILIYYTDEHGNHIVEIGYLCGEKLIKGASMRYPYPSHWMPLPKPPKGCRSGHYFPEMEGY